MDLACPEKDVTEILSDSDHLTKVAPTTLRIILITLIILYYALKNSSVIGIDYS